MKKYILIVSVIVVVAVAALVVGKEKEQTAVQPPEIVAPVATENRVELPETDDKEVELAYGTAIRFPAEYADMVEHTQENYNGCISEVFSLKSDETEVSMYRLDFGDRESGDWLGMLRTDEGDISVTYTVFGYDQEEFAGLDDHAKEGYTILMESFNNLLSSIAADSRFLEEVTIDPGEENPVEMTYWTVNLPAGISWMENNQDGNYQASFYGEVCGERTALYTVHIGEPEARNVLGQFKVGEDMKNVSVESFDLPENANWTEDDKALAYCMMDTINNVIERIISSELYSEPESE